MPAAPVRSVAGLTTGRVIGVGRHGGPHLLEQAPPLHPAAQVLSARLAIRPWRSFLAAARASCSLIAENRGLRADEFAPRPDSTTFAAAIHVVHRAGELAQLGRHSRGAEPAYAPLRTGSRGTRRLERMRHRRTVRTRPAADDRDRPPSESSGRLCVLGRFRARVRLRARSPLLERSRTRLQVSAGRWRSRPVRASSWRPSRRAMGGASPPRSGPGGATRLRSPVGVVSAASRGSAAGW